jgi:tRNA threonylcarbamoyladenosine biosynthesis protein TsaB
MIREVLGDSALEPGQLDAVVLGNGPGSFIGLRIAAAVASGIAHAAGLRVVPVSSLSAVAMRAGEPGDVVAVAQDAHMGEVYLGVYRLDEDGFPQALCDERLQKVGPFDELAGLAGPGTSAGTDASRRGGRVVAAGAGFVRYPGLAGANGAVLAGPATVFYPHAEELLALGARAYRAGHALAPENVDPAYLRHQVATPAAGRGP